MRKIKVNCILWHLRSRVCDCDIKKYENNDEAITAYTCKYCKKPLLIFTRYIKAHFKAPIEAKHED